MKIVLGIILIIVIAGGGFYILNSTSKSSGLNSKTEEESREEISREVSALSYCSGVPIVELTEGPYYKSGSPERRNITESDTIGTPLVLTGYVFDKDCNPIANAWLDFWQADGKGEYDNTGYNLRGHQYTDSDGKYTLETVVPAKYPGRTEHIHFKVSENDESRVITSQLFFPGNVENESDSIFQDSLIVDVLSESEDTVSAAFNIIIP